MKDKKPLSFYQPGGMSAKWLQMGDEPMPAPTRDIFWITAMVILKCMML